MAQEKGSRMREMKIFYRKSITLIETLVILFIIMIIVLVLIPVVAQQRFIANLNCVLLNMKCYVLELHSNIPPDHEWRYRYWEFPMASMSNNIPQKHRWNNSTEYLSYICTSYVLNIKSPSLFGAPGLPPTDNWENFASSGIYNAWCIVSDIDKFYPDQAPFIFTRNFGQNSDTLFSRLDSISTNENSRLKKHLYGNPFQNDGFVVLNVSMDGTIYYGSELEEKVYNIIVQKSAYNKQLLRNIILRPEIPDI